MYKRYVTIVITSLKSNILKAMTQKMKHVRQLSNKITDSERGTPRLQARMEFENRDFRAMIYYDMKRGLAYTESHKNLCAAFGVNAPGKSTVYKWFKNFSFGRERLFC